MGISDICIRRPVFSIVLSLLLVTAGAIALMTLPLRQFPAFDEAAVTVVTALPGASASQIEAQVSTPLEDAVATIAGIKTISSTSLVGESIVSITFQGDIDPIQAGNEVGTKAQSILPQLPEGAKAPVVTLASANDSQTCRPGLQPRRVDRRNADGFKIPTGSRRRRAQITGAETGVLSAFDRSAGFGGGDDASRRPWRGLLSGARPAYRPCGTHHWRR
jgi:hypothetical protein